MSEYSNIISANFNAAPAKVVAATDDNPDDAARAIDLSESTGVPATSIAGDLEGFDQAHKRRLASDIVRNNPQLADYINSHPLAASMSNDDYANLDKVSQTATALKATRRVVAAPTAAMEAGLAEGWQKMKEGWGQPGAWMSDEDVKNHQLLGAIGLTAELPIRGLNALMQGGLGAVKGGTSSLYQSFGGSPQVAEQFSRDVTGMAEMQMIGGGVHSAAPPTPKMIEGIRAARPWLEQGVEPPKGVHPEIDRLKAEANDRDLKQLEQALTESQSSTTRERNPDMFAGFMRQHLGEAKIGISGDRIVELYGDRIPAPDDGLLGWVPGIKEQLEAARETGTDIQVPIADWLAKVDPAVAKDLHDDIRVQSGNITAREVELEKVGNEAVPLPVQSVEAPLAQARAAASLEPLFSIGDRKLTLARLTPEEASIQFGPEAGFHDFSLSDEQGRLVGTINLSTQQGGKQLYIEMINGINGLGPRDFGPSLMRDILRQIKAEFPEAESITGHRVSGARDKAGTYNDPRYQSPVVKLDAVDDTILRKLQDSLQQQQWEKYSENLSAKPVDFMTENERRLVDAVESELKRIVPKQVETEPVSGIAYKGKTGAAEGAHIQYSDRNPIIIYSLAGPDTVGVARHEAIHHLRQYGFFNEAEWNTLSEAAKSEGWEGRYGIDRKYGHLSNEGRLEESIAEGYRDWKANKDNLTNRALEAIRGESAVAKVFRKLDELLERIKTAFKSILGHEPTWEELFGKVDTGEIGSREGMQPLNPAAFQERLSVAEDQANVLRANALGLDLKSFKQIQKLIEARHAADVEAAMKRAEAQQRLRQGKEWREQRAELRKDVADTIENRPDVAADLFFSSGELFGKKLAGSYKLRADNLTPEQRAALPKNYLAKDGLPPDEAAKLFGYGSGDAMIEKLAEYNRIKGDLSARDFVKKVIDTETDRQMEARNGLLEKNIMEDAKDQALAESGLNLIAEEYHAAGMKAGVATIDKNVATAWVKDKFGKLAIGDITSDKFLADVGRHGRDAERALIGDKPADAVVSLQKKYLSALFASEARKLEKEQKQFEKLAKTFARPFDPVKSHNIDSEYSLGIRDILNKVGRQNGLSIQGLEDAIANSRYGNLADFVAKQERENQISGLEIPVADFLLDPKFRKPVDQMSVYEFRGLKQSIDVLNKLGRDIQKVVVQGEKQDRADWVKAGNEQLANKFDEIVYPLNKKSVIKDAWNSFLAASTNNETLMARFDGRDPKGMFTEMFTYPAAKAANSKATLERQYAKKYEEVGPVKDGKKLLDSPLIDPLSGKPYEGFTRANLATVISNMGNDYNWRILTRGHKIDPNVLWKWIEDNSTVEDIERAQKLGKVFDSAKGESDMVYRHLYGIAPENITVRPFIMHGQQFEGWYHPIIRDPIRSAKLNELNLEENNNFWPSTANGYTKRRTGAIDIVDLSHDMVPVKLNQMLHDIAFRDFIYNTSKIVKDRGFQEGVTKFYGKEYVEEINQWMTRIAGNASYDSNAMALANRISTDARQNVVSTYIAFSLTTPQKHGITAWMLSSKELGSMPKFLGTSLEVAASSFSHAVMDLFGKSPQMGDSIYQWAKKNSEELQRRERFVEESVQGQHNILQGNSTLRSTIMRWGSKMVSFSDMLSAVPLWVAKYREVFAEEGNHGRAVEQADRAVRRAHGSTAITNLPRIATGSNPVSPWLTTLYGFFGTIQQRRLEIAHDINDAYKLGKEGEIKEAAKQVPQIASSIFTHVLWVGLVEQAVEHQFSDNKRSSIENAVAFALGGMAQSLIGVRDLVSGLARDRDPSVGLLSSPLHDVKSLFDDVKKNKPLSKQNAGKLVQDSITVFGHATGMGPKHVGTVVRYGMDAYNGVQRPKTAGDVYRGAVSGKQEKHHE